MSAKGQKADITTSIAQCELSHVSSEFGNTASPLRTTSSSSCFMLSSPLVVSRCHSGQIWCAAVGLPRRGFSVLAPAVKDAQPVGWDPPACGTKSGSSRRCLRLAQAIKKLGVARRSGDVEESGQLWSTGDNTPACIIGAVI
jgi:hypothetical protein